MSGLNYSKWDNLELSDDEDIECHPNVDKKSFIKWKQESIHQERAQRNHKIQQLEQRIQSNKKVMPMIEQAIESVKTAPEDKLEDFLDTLQEKVLEDNEKLQRKVAKSSSGADKNVYNNAETPEDIFLSFLSFVQADIHRDSMELTKFNLQAKMVEELGKVKTHDEQCRTELEKEKKIKNSKLTSENLYKPGFDKTIVNKSTAVNTPPPASKPKAKAQTIETLNQDSLDRQMQNVNITESHASQEDEDEDIEISDVALKFSELDTLQKSYEFISRNPYIIESRFQDEILAHALELELAKKPKASKLAVHQSLLLSYCEKLGRDGISIFFKGLHERGKGMFMEDVDNTYSILKKRCKVIEEEQRNQKEKAVFQLHLADPESKIVVNIPNDSEEHKQAKEIFDTLPKDFQEALKSSDLDIINKCLAEYDENDAETMLQICDQGGFLSFSVPPMESINQPPQ